METLAHQIRLVPTPLQEEYFRKACGTARFAWNWALSEWKQRCEAGERVDGLKLKKEFNARKTVEFPWTYEVTKYASQQPFLHLQAAFRRFLEKKARYPRFKRRGVHDSFYIGGDHIEVSGKRIRIPRLGWVRMREEVRFRGKVVSATVRRIADRWFVSVHVELEEAPVRCESQASVGVDLGVNRLATLSNGATFEGAKPLRQQLKRLRRWSQRLSRRQKGSNNRDKARQKLARLHYRIRCIRQDGLHKLTSYLTENFALIAIEDLNVQGMLTNRRLARAVADMGFHEFRRQVDYKARMRGNHLEVVDRWFASSKTCSDCGLVKEALSLGERRFRCEGCGFESDRDLNAALNLFRTVSSTGSQACGEGGSGPSSSWSETTLCESGTQA
jgi:putative transposase